ncbi:unnamed protein product [Amoebophrya sp. A120]|nr:unnamed protein product [Amoebophrya sp. A120]|eukprot:GSA120T00018808001.1
MAPTEAGTDDAAPAPHTSATELRPELSFVTTLARSVGDRIRASFGLGNDVFFDLSDVDIKLKASAADLVTEVDVAVEKIITEAILADFPNHKILGEETAIEGVSKLTADKTWIIDPIDGTTNFVHGVPYVGVSIGYYENFEPVLGVVYNPILDELFAAERGKGAFLECFESKTRKPGSTNITVQLKKIALSRRNASSKTLQESLVGTGFQVQELAKLRDTTRRDELDEKQIAALHRIKETVARNTMAVVLESRDLRRSGSAACDLCNVACGRLDCYFETGIKEWDVAAGILICQEAGCVIADYTGKMLAKELDGRRIVAAANPTIMKQVVELIEM